MSTIINAGRIAPIPKGDYNAATAYEHLDIVSYEGSSYICKQDTTAGILPTNTEYWQLMSGQATPIDLSEYAKLASPAFTGTPTAPTATSGTNTTQLATTAFVQTAISGKQDTLTFDNVPTDHSTNPVISGGVYSAINDVTKLTITVTYDDGDNIVADKTYTQILAAYNRGREIVLLDHGAIAPLIAYEEGTNTFTFDQESSSNPTFHIIYTVKRENNADVWTWRGYGVQSALVSGTNIKTVNGESLLGSGDIDADDVIMGKIDGTSFYKVISYSALNAIPTFSDTAETGNENKIYVDILTDRAYRWDKGIVSVGESNYKLLSEELSVVTDNEINSLLPLSTKKAVSAKVLRDNFYTETEVDNLLSSKQATLTFDTTPTVNSTNPVTSGGIYNVIGDIETLLASI